MAEETGESQWKTYFVPRTPHTAYVGLGSNLGDRAANIDAALRMLREPGAPAIVSVRASSLIETEAVGMEPATPPFLNGAAEVKTNLSALALLELLKGIERRLGRGQRD